jgi:hypothetical protein
MRVPCVHCMHTYTPLQARFAMSTNMLSHEVISRLPSLRSFLHCVVTWNQSTSLVCCGHISTSRHGGCLHHACHAATAHCMPCRSLTHPQAALTNSLTSLLTSTLTGQLTHQLTRPPMCIHPPAHPHLTPSSPPLARSPGTAASSVTRATSTRT